MKAGKLITRSETKVIFEDLCKNIQLDQGNLIMKILGGKWKLLIISRIYVGFNRFNNLEKSINGISKNILSLNLKNLERDNIISRHKYDEVVPKVEYRLTKSGNSLVPILKILGQWYFNYYPPIKNKEIKII